MSRASQAAFLSVFEPIYTAGSMDLESGAAAWRPVAIWWWHGGHMLAAWWRVALWRPVAASFPNDALKVALFWLYGGRIVA